MAGPGHRPPLPRNASVHLSNAPTCLRRACLGRTPSQVADAMAVLFCIVGIAQALAESAPRGIFFNLSLFRFGFDWAPWVRHRAMDSDPVCSASIGRSASVRTSVPLTGALYSGSWYGYDCVWHRPAASDEARQQRASTGTQ